MRIVLGAAMVASVALGLWLGRDTFFTFDELDWFSSSAHFDLRTAVDPYIGHLVLTSRVVYAAIFNLFGPGYLPFRLLAAGSVLLTTGLFFVFAKRRIGAVAALAPTLVLLFYGSDKYHVISGNAFTIQLSLAAGIGALIALDRDDQRGDVGACLLLFLALATYSVALAFLAAAAVLILLGDDRRRRAWVFLLPALFYGAWLLWSHSAGGSTTESNLTLSNLLLAPNWALNSLAVVVASLVGLNYEELGSGWGPVVALAALAALGWRVWRGSIPRWLWATMAVPATLWVIGAASAEPPFRTPSNPRYVFPGTIAVLLVAVEASRGVRLGRRGMLVLYGVAAIGLATNVVQLRHDGAELRGAARTIRADLTAVEIAGPHFGPRLAEARLLGAVMRETGQRDVVTGYTQAVREFGSPAFLPSELRGQSESVRERVDGGLADSLHLGLQPASGPVGHCRRVSGRSVRLPPGGAVLRTKGAPAPLMLRRFGSAFTVEAGTLDPDVAKALTIPRDAAPDPWYASTSATALLVCGS